jgi:DNA-binding CsgD family transcriptional regulator
LVTLRRPLQAAASLSHTLSFAQVSGMADAFEHLGKPALVLDEGGLLIRCNASAERILGTLAGFRHGEIRFHENANQRSFEAALTAAGLDVKWSGRTLRAAVLRDAAGRAWTLDATMLGDWGRYSFTQARYLLLFDEIRAEPPGTAAWRTRYGLTPAEVRVAESLAAGLSVRAIADRHGVTYETARTQLKAVLSKTGANRQSELVSLLMREQARSG